MNTSKLENFKKEFKDLLDKYNAIIGAECSGDTDIIYDAKMTVTFNDEGILGTDYLLVDDLAILKIYKNLLTSSDNRV